MNSQNKLYNTSPSFLNSGVGWNLQFLLLCKRAFRTGQTTCNSRWWIGLRKMWFFLTSRSANVRKRKGRSGRWRPRRRRLSRHLQLTRYWLLLLTSVVTLSNLHRQNRFMNKTTEITLICFIAFFLTFLVEGNVWFWLLFALCLEQMDLFSPAHYPVIKHCSCNLTSSVSCSGAL